MTDAERPLPSEDVFRRLLEAMAEGVVLTGEDGRILYANPAMERMFGYGPGEILGAHVGRLNGLPAEAAMRLSAEVEAAMAAEGAWRGGWLQRRKDGSTFESSIHISKVELEGRAHWLAVQEDVTEKAAVERALRASEAGLRLAVDAAQIGVWRLDETTGALIGTPELNRVLGFDEDATPTLAEVRARYGPGELDRVRAAASEALRRGERHFEVEFQAQKPDGAPIWLQMRAEVSPHKAGRPRATTGVLIDITARKTAEERMQLLAREVDHRANNLLTVIQGVIALTRAPDVESFRTVLAGRIAALGQAHQLLAESRWERAELRRLAEEELRPFRLGEAERATIEGPAVDLAAHAAQAVAIALHELATNAAKHGALSVPEGRVRLAWRGGGEEALVIDWCETHGPATSPPTQRGLGLSVIERALGGAIAGSARFDWRPEGLCCELVLPPGGAHRAGS
jgi:PAS domain S-box-containing protein